MNTLIKKGINFAKVHKFELLCIGIVGVGAIAHALRRPARVVIEGDAIKDLATDFFEDGWRSCAEYITENGLEGAADACPEITSVVTSIITE